MNVTATLGPDSSSTCQKEWMAPATPLYEVAPSAFVEARNRLAADLKKAGRAAEAAAVKALAKPNASVWATNQLARRAPDELAGFLEAQDALERAQTTAKEDGRE